MENEFQKSFLETTNLPDIQTYFVNQVFEFQELMMRYNCAIREVRTKLEVLNDELSIHHKRNPKIQCCQIRKCCDARPL